MTCAAYEWTTIILSTERSRRMCGVREDPS